MVLVEVALRARDEPVNQRRPADQPDAAGRGVRLEEFPVAEPFDDDGFRYGHLALRQTMS